MVQIRIAVRLAACAALLTWATSARGVVIASGDGSGNTAAPEDDFGFGNVAVVGVYAGTYLGDGWVLTANHVAGQPTLSTTLKGVTYQPVPGSGVRLTNPGRGAPDLHLFRIAGDPQLLAVALSSQTPVIGELVYCAGRGWTRAPTPTLWNAAWSEVPRGSLIDHVGFKSIVQNTLRWGTNAVDATGSEVLDTRAFEMVFDRTGATAHESQAVSGDSGGGCFAKRDGTWELVGVMFAEGFFTSQPAATAVFGNRTFAADVAYYRDQIRALIASSKSPLGRDPQR
jgi:hypothetical protein